MYGKSNIETYITICKIDSQWELAAWLRKHKQHLCINLEGWDGVGDGREVQKDMNICIFMAHLQFHSFIWQNTTKFCKTIQFSSVQSLSCVWFFATPWTTAHQASLSITNSRSPAKPMSIEWVMPSNHFILCRPFLLLSSICPRIRVFSNESALCIRWPKYWNFSFNISPSNEHPGLISFRMDWLDHLAVQGTLTNTTVQKHQFCGT